MKKGTLNGLLFVLASLALMSVFYITTQLMLPRVEILEPMEVEVLRGENFAQVAIKLKRVGLIKDLHVFNALGRLSGLHKKLTPGFYQFHGSPRPWDVYRTLREGRVIAWQITVVEGDTLREVKEKLTEEEIMSPEDFDRLSCDLEFLQDLRVEAPSLEGYLYPETYSISKGTSAEDVFRMMVRRMRASFDEPLLARAAEMGMSEHEVLTLASIVEKEAILNRERPIISGVYHNRLKKGMRLQADPTAIYGLKPQSAGVTRRDIRRNTTYNTYFVDGLPPGPISAPGIKSIRATLYPADVPYLYFVANNEGGHSFSVTLQEHQQASVEYKKKRLAAKLNAVKEAREKAAEVKAARAEAARAEEVRLKAAEGSGAETAEGLGEPGPEGGGPKGPVDPGETAGETE